jgi:hypothetical protein
VFRPLRSRGQKTGGTHRRLSVVELLPMAKNSNLVFNDLGRQRKALFFVEQTFTGSDSNDENAGSGLDAECRKRPRIPVWRKKKSDGNAFFCGQVALMADPFTVESQKFRFFFGNFFVILFFLQPVIKVCGQHVSILPENKGVIRLQSFAAPFGHGRAQIE